MVTCSSCLCLRGFWRQFAAWGVRGSPDDEGDSLRRGVWLACVKAACRGEASRRRAGGSAELVHGRAGLGASRHEQCTDGPAPSQDLPVSSPSGHDREEFAKRWAAAPKGVSCLCFPSKSWGTLSHSNGGYRTEHIIRWTSTRFPNDLLRRPSALNTFDVDLAEQASPTCLTPV